MFKIIYLLALGFFVAGCSTQIAQPQIDFKPPKYVEQMPSLEEEDVSSIGSLYGSGDRPLFSDRKAMKINDIVTVLVTENANSSSKGSKKIDRKNGVKLAPSKLSYGGNSAAINSAVNGVNDVAAIGFDANNESSFEGSGSNDRTEQFNTTLSARIVKVMVNGNYFIEGSKEILINGEKQIIQLSGVIRPYDIDIANQIKSTMIADARILYKTQGDIDRASTKGWGTKMLEVLWPF